MNMNLLKSGPSPDPYLYLTKREGVSKLNKGDLKEEGRKMESQRFKGNYIGKIRLGFQEMGEI